MMTLHIYDMSFLGWSEVIYERIDMGNSLSLSLNFHKPFLKSNIKRAKQKYFQFHSIMFSMFRSLLL